MYDVGSLVKKNPYIHYPMDNTEHYNTNHCT